MTGGGQESEGKAALCVDFLRECEPRAHSRCVLTKDSEVIHRFARLGLGLGPCPCARDPLLAATPSCPR